MSLYFAYGTTQQGFTHHAGLGLGERVARVRTAAPHAVVVPRRAGCSNPGCRYVHRMAALVPGFGIHAEGDLFEVESFADIDALELNGPYARREIALSDGFTAEAYLAAEPELWRALAERGEADALESYPGYPERLKDCCVRAPGHAPPHDTGDPLMGVRRAPPAPG
jgi:gamma-glutamyl AIG2-like cyclotransferase